MATNTSLVYRYHGGRKRNIKYDFSVNVNPLGPPKIVYEVIKKNLDLIRYYPEETSWTLKKIYAKKWKLKPENIIIGNGASELIFLYINMLSPDRIIVPIPSFSEYYIASSLKERELIMPMYIEKGADFLPSIENILAAISPFSLLIIGNPNNPTGTLYQKEELLEIIKHAKEKDAHVFIDESFIDFVDKRYDIYEFINMYTNLFILKSFTKIFSIPGIRFGIGIGSEKIIEQLEERRDPWSVNIFAQHLGGYLIREDKFIEETKKFIHKEREFIYKHLSTNSQLKIYNTYANFYLLKFLKISSKETIDFLLKNDIYVRNASNFIGLSDKFIRVAIKTRRENKLFLRYIKSFIENLHFS